MASSQPHSLPPDVQENIVHNIQKTFPNYVDKKVIRAVLNRECWDLEKSLAFLKNSLQSFNDHPHNAKKKDNKFKKPNQTKPVPPKGNACNNNTPSPNKPPELLKNFKKKTRTRKNKQQNVEKEKKDGDWVMVNNPKTAKPDPPKELENKSQNNERMLKRKIMIQHYEIIKQFGEPLNRISAYINDGIRVMILLRGCSGSGKTTYASQLLKKHGAKNLMAHLFSTDNFFTNKDGKYTFNYDLLQNAHEWNQKMVRLAVSEGRSPIFVDNTNTRLWEMKEYACMAVEFGYVLETLEPPTPWFFNEDMLIRKTLHHVPRETIKKMLDRYEANISGEDVLRGLQLSYSSLSPPQGVMAGLEFPPSKKHVKLYNERLNFESHNKTSNKQASKTSVKGNLKTSESNRFRAPKLMETPVVPPSYKPMEGMQYQENRPMRFGWPGSYPANSNFNTNNFADPGNFNIQNQQLRFSQPCYQPNNGPYMTAAVPNVFNSPFNGSMAPLNLTRADPGLTSEFHLLNRAPSSGPSKENNINSVSYVDDLIDLTVPEDVKVSDDLPGFSGSCNDLSSSISLLEGLRIDNELSSNLESDSDEDDMEEEQCGSDEEESSESESEDGEGSSMSNMSVYSNKQQSSLEYVFIPTTGSIMFQKTHEETADIKTLDDFKKTSTSSLSNFPKNFEDFLFQYMENSKINVKEDCSKGTVISLDSSNTVYENKKSDLLCTNITNRVRPSTCLGNWDYAKELPKEIPSEAPKDQRTKAEAKKTSISSSTNTNYADFENLRAINSGGTIVGTPTIKNGSFNFVSEVSKVPYQHSSQLLLDKGVMTSDIETSQVVVRDSGIERLILMFPKVPRENLEELFDKCQKDIDWTAGLLLDSGQEMSELYTPLEPIECSNYDDKILISPRSSDMKVEDALQTEIKKQKKKKNDLDENKFKDIKEKIQSNFVLGENHYSEKMKKHIERRHNIQIGKSTEIATGIFPEDEGILEDETSNTDNVIEGSDSEEDAVFMLDSDFIFQLQSRFGGLLRPNMIGEKTVVSMPSGLARQLHSYIMDSVFQQIEGEDIFTDDSVMSKDEELARHLQDEELKSRGVPSLLEIMDEEVALRKTYTQKDFNSGKSMASTLSKKLLIERFPHMDPATLATILEDTNHSLYEATCLLSSAGHLQVEPKQEAEANDTETPPKKTISREEAIKQADAYGDVASKLYELRKDCLRKSQEAYREGNSSVALYYSDMARWYMEKIEKSNTLAAKAILSGYEGWTTLDLHFLQVSEALNVLDLFVDEVIRGLQESKNKKAVVYVITGRGLHSVGGRPRLKPAVQSRLLKRELRYVEQNPGMLKVTITRTALTSYNREIAACA